MKQQRKMLGIDPDRIVLFCSLGNHFDAAAHELKRQFPRARLTVVAPPWRSEPLAKAGLINSTIEMTTDKLHLVRNLGECFRVLVSVRTEQPDLLVTMYDSRALNLLQSLSGSRAHAIYDSRGTLYPIELGRAYPVRVLFGGVGRAIVGALAYAAIASAISVWNLFRRD